jgi:predicted phage terminase large subunit-like protein
MSILSDFSAEELRAIMGNIHKLPVHEQAETLALLEELVDRKEAVTAKDSLLAFAHRVAPVLQIETEPKIFMVGPHHRKLAALMDAVARGEKRRILISVAPRFGKSLVSSYLFPAWYLGKFPNRRIIMASHTGDMATGFGRKVRDLINTPEYRTIFPDVELKADSKAAGQWSTSGGGEYYAVGVGGALAGRGANLVVIDDPFSEQVVMAGNTDVFDDAWAWFQTGPLQRLAPDGACIIIHTRWHKGDLIGRLQTQMAKNPDAEQWDVVEFPAILNTGTDHEKSLWPERWPLEALLQKKQNMAPQYWQAQYMQSPTSEEGAMIKREWWQVWDKEDPPDCEYVIMSLDAAQEAHNRADYNAFQVWGVFYEDTGRGAPVANIILLEAWKKRMEYPELKKAMIAEYEKWDPDTFVIEKKSSGSVLYQELRHAGVPVSEFTPGKGNDKIARVNSVSDIFSSGLVWAPTDRRWAMEVVEECSDFPNGEHDDQVDAMTLAIRRFRTGGFIKLPTDEQDEESMYPRKHKYY